MSQRGTFVRSQSAELKYDAIFRIPRTLSYPVFFWACFSNGILFQTPAGRHRPLPFQVNSNNDGCRPIFKHQWRMTDVICESRRTTGVLRLDLVSCLVAHALMD